MKDFLGNDIYAGDQVVYIVANKTDTGYFKSCNFNLATVTKICKKMLEVSFNDNQEHKRIRSDKVVVVSNLIRKHGS